MIIVGWTTLAVWLLWLILYWAAGIRLVSNFTRAFRDSKLHYDRYFILGLVVLSNVLIWTGYGILRGYIEVSFRSDFLSIAGGVLMSLGALGTFWCKRQMRSSWSAHTMLVENHRLIDTGIYRYIRHPIYAFASLMSIGSVMVFPVWWNIIAGMGMVALYVLKTILEERMLVHQLPGYEEYKQRVRYRFAPRIW